MMKFTKKLRLTTGTDLPDVDEDSTPELRPSTSSCEPVITTLRSEGNCAQTFIVNPYSVRRSSWDLLSLLLVLYDIVTIPLELFDPPATDFSKFMAWSTRLFWTSDMPLSFISGFVRNDGTIEMRPLEIVKRYLATWFLLDCTVVGVDWVEVVAAGGATGYAKVGKASRTFRIVRMIRLLRLLRMGEIFGLITERIYSEKVAIVVDIFKIMTIIIGLAHLIACIWYGISANEDSQFSWIRQFDSEHHRSLADFYGMSMHWSLSQFAGGMDEVTPENESERAFAIVMFVLGFVLASVFVGRLTSSMTQLNMIGNAQSQQLTILRRYLYQNGISRKLAVRVQRNAQHAILEEQRVMPELSVEMLSKVSDPLRVELHFEMYTPVLNWHPFFNAYTSECPQVMRKVCHSATAMLSISSGDVLFTTGEIPAHPQMYFICSGMFHYLMRGHQPIEVNVNEWISEAALWTQWMHIGDLRARNETRLCRLDSRVFGDIVSQFDHADFDPKVYAVEFVNNLNSCMAEVSDLSPDMSFFEDDAIMEALSSSKPQQEGGSINAHSDSMALSQAKSLFGRGFTMGHGLAVRRSYHSGNTLRDLIMQCLCFRPAAARTSRRTSAIKRRITSIKSERDSAWIQKGSLDSSA